MYTSPNLENLYVKYEISSLQHGKLEDKLGDVYEQFIVDIFNNIDYLKAFRNNQSIDTFEFDIYCKILLLFGFSSTDKIDKVSATSNIAARLSHGNPKTDVIIYVTIGGVNFPCPISIKQSSVKKVAFAEFDVKTIAEEVGITDERVLYFLNKHQTDASAKNFTADEKEEFCNILKPYARKLVQWVVTGSPEESTDTRIPKAVLKFDVKKENHLLHNYSIYKIDEYIDNIMLNPKTGLTKKGGFGTGLSWTYATGSKGKKIQFKG